MLLSVNMNPVTASEASHACWWQQQPVMHFVLRVAPVKKSSMNCSKCAKRLVFQRSSRFSFFAASPSPSKPLCSALPASIFA